MENKEDYIGYEDQELCNQYYKEAEAMRQKQDWSRLRAVPAPAKGTPSPGWGKKYICMFDVNILMIDTGQKVASNWNPTEHDIMSNDWEIAG